MATSASPASSSLSPANSGHAGSGDHLQHDAVVDSVPVEALVEHLLAAKRALSYMTLVLHANSLSTHARQLHEESVILGAQTVFLEKAIADQHSLLAQVCDNMSQTNKAVEREFNLLLKTMDGIGDKLSQTAAMLKNTTVDPVFRPEGEEAKNLMDFVDEQQDAALRNAMFASINEFQVSDEQLCAQYAASAAKLTKPLRDRPFKSTTMVTL